MKKINTRYQLDISENEPETLIQQDADINCWRCLLAHPQSKIQNLKSKIRSLNWRNFAGLNFDLGGA